MKTVIIEDEHLSAERLADLLVNINPDTEVLEILDSVSSAIEWFRKHRSPDLLFVDIQLADGLSFDIFQTVEVDCPVIFTTAYQEYAIRAFRLNSIDYLLKPVHPEDLRQALEKYEKYYGERTPPPVPDKELLDSIRAMITRSYKSRFMVKVGDRIRTIETSEISYFYSLEKGTYLRSREGRSYSVDFTLDALGELLDPSLFHRINRRYLITHKAIRDLITLSGTKLKVVLHHSEEDEIFISRDRISRFKQWLDD